MNYQEEVDKIITDVEQKLETLKNVYRLQQKFEVDMPYKGDWCFFWDGDATFESGEPIIVGRFLQRAFNGYVACNSTRVWDNCRKIKPEDFGWTLDGKPDWKDAPEWAKYLAMDRDGRWYWYESEAYTNNGRWCTPGKIQLASKRPDWEKTLESRPE